jgi:hypothetical protein
VRDGRSACGKGYDDRCRPGRSAREPRSSAPLLAPLRPAGHYAQVRRSIVSLGVSAATGTVLWLALVVALPSDDTSAPAFWWLMLLGAFGLEAIFGPRCIGHVALGLALGPLVLSPWTAPRGDGDGLWVLWIPLLALFPLVLAMPAWLGSAARQRLHVHT